MHICGPYIIVFVLYLFILFYLHYVYAIHANQIKLKKIIINSLIQKIIFFINKNNLIFFLNTNIHLWFFFFYCQIYFLLLSNLKEIRIGIDIFLENMVIILVKKKHIHKLFLRFFIYFLSHIFPCLVFVVKFYILIL